MSTPAQVQVQVDRGRVGEPLELGIERQGVAQILVVVTEELNRELF
ncbi:hypothetical protein FLM9_661 [Candidatus Synechococcus spongiarum]|uniref:Uncharacterized protein n=1 Tax=Candidatus Synechococcus spongiarum TaxID=431041 RepID=A0A164Z4J8_9SYNE|nr:hypothetical protein FLM9_661 [Candidatus Synechococcus spongiarum]